MTNEAGWKLTPLGKGFYNLDLGSVSLKMKVFTRGNITLKKRNPMHFSLGTHLQSKHVQANKCTGLDMLFDIAKEVGLL